MKEAYKVMIVILLVILAMLMCSCQSKGAKKSDDVPSENSHPIDIIVSNETGGESTNKQTVSDSSEQETDFPSTSKNEPVSEYEEKTFNIDDFPYGTRPLDKNINYNSDVVSVETSEEFDEVEGKTKYFCTVYNLSEDEIEVDGTFNTHAYIGGGEWVDVTYGDSSLDVFVIAPGESVKIQYWLTGLPEGTYRIVGRFWTSDTIETQYFSFMQ